MHKRGIALLSIMAAFLFILTACFQGEQSMDKEEIDPPKNAEEVNNLGDAADETDEADNNSEETKEQMVSRQLYLIDSNGLVAPQTVQIPLENEVAAQALEYLVKDGPIASLLPNGFRAVLPAGTQVLGLDLKKDGTLVVDVSNEFKEYKAEDETKILEAMTYTLTQFDNVEKIKLEINGYPQNEMPVNNTPIGDGYARANGINLIQSDNVDFISSEPVTMYYPAVQGDSEYFVPVTQYIKTKDEVDVYTSVLKALMDGPGLDANVQHVFNSNTELVNEPTLRDGVLEVEFTEQILKDKTKGVIADDVIGTVVRTLTADQEVEAVNVKVKGLEQLFNENGEAYTKPVSKQMLTPEKKL